MPLFLIINEKGHPRQSVGVACVRGLRGFGLDRRGDDGRVVGRVLATATTQIVDQLRGRHRENLHVAPPSCHPHRVRNDLCFRVGRMMALALGLDAHLGRRDGEMDRGGDRLGLVEVSDFDDPSAIDFDSAQTIHSLSLLFGCNYISDFGCFKV